MLFQDSFDIELSITMSHINNPSPINLLPYLLDIWSKGSTTVNLPSV